MTEQIAGEFTMTQEEAKAAIVREFHALPEAKQLSTIERLAFVRQMMEKYKFRALGSSLPTHSGLVDPRTS